MGYATNCFSKRLKEVREAAGLTQAQLASELEVSRGAISYYEKGERTPDIEFLDKFSDYFNLPLDFAIGYTNNITVEHRNMYELYGLTDKACKELDFHPEIGHLISEIIEHKQYSSLKRLYNGILKNHTDFNFSQKGYIGFLISDTLNRIILDSLATLKNMRLSAEEKASLTQEVSEAYKEIDELIKRIEEDHAQIKQESEKEEELLKQQDEEKNAVRYDAIEKVYDQFEETVHDAEFYREFPE